MNILMLNTSQGGGGAALASSRLAAALRKSGHNVERMVMLRAGDDPTVTTPWSGSRLKYWLCRRHFLAERLGIFARLGFKKKHLWEIDTASTGVDICHSEAFRRADVVHLHWVNQGFLSLHSIQKLLRSGKPVVWTMHDLWPVAAICHYARDCRRFVSGCHDCPLLPPWPHFDTARSVYDEKKRTYRGHRIHFVGCSRWIAKEAEESLLTRDATVVSIPNPIDTDVFSPGSRDDARQMFSLPTNKRLLLWAAQKVTDERKGLQHLLQALEMLKQQHPDEAREMGVVILGARADQVAQLFPVATYPLGFLSSQQQIVAAYRAADAFVLPSMEDNLPNTIMEAMACGIPQIGFSVGGVPEMIAHRHTGYVARLRDSSDLAAGIYHVLYADAARSYGMAAREKACRCYSESVVAQQFVQLYTQAIDESQR